MRTRRAPGGSSQTNRLSWLDQIARLDKDLRLMIVSRINTPTVIDHSGVMIHLVPDEGVDSGPVLAQERIDFLPGDTLESFAQRMHALEHRLYVETLHRLIVQVQSCER